MVRVSRFPEKYRFFAGVPYSFGSALARPGPVVLPLFLGRCLESCSILLSFHLFSSFSFFLYRTAPTLPSGGGPCSATRGRHAAQQGSLYLGLALAALAVPSSGLAGDRRCSLHRKLLKRKPLCWRLWVFGVRGKGREARRVQHTASGTELGWALPRLACLLRNNTPLPGQLAGRS